MKLYKPILLFLTFTILSCKSQELTTIKYQARTRGYQYELTLHNNILTIIKNNQQKQITLSKTQLKDIRTIIESINFKVIRNNTSTKNFAVDRAIPVYLEITHNTKNYKFNLDSSKMPEEINGLIKTLKSID